MTLKFGSLLFIHDTSIKTTNKKIKNKLSEAGIAVYAEINSACITYVWSTSKLIPLNIARNHSDVIG